MAAVPFRLIENRFFKEFLHKLNKTYKLPTRKKLSNTLLKKTFSDVKTIVEHRTAETKSNVVSIDGSSTNSQCSIEHLITAIFA